MKETSFDYHGRTYRCFVAVSKEEYPHYYWCYLSDPELIKELGECISYNMEAGGPVHLTEAYAEECHDLLELIRVMVVQPLVTDHFTAERP